MTVVKANGIDIKVEEYGSKKDPALLLICGWSVQLTFWPKPFIQSLVDAGYRVITFDNRDVGLSEKFHHRPATYPFAPHVMASRLLKRKFLVAYTLEDMAADAMGVLDALNIPRAHIVGLSMGGMITQVVAAKYPERVRSATILMSTTNRPGLPLPPMDLAFDIFFRRRGRNPSHSLQRTQDIWRRIRTQDGGYDDANFEEALSATIDRAYYPPGRRRQMEAIMATGDLRRFTRRIVSPTLVIHGSADLLARPHGGLDIAANIPGARFELIEGMGHDLPPRRIGMIAGMIAGHAKAADARKTRLKRVA
ncbi:MAG: alpha/beta hydrolase [Hyphomonas sp.]|nr:alpha/beta hydrolase [Hyphomonas sp.]